MKISEFISNFTIKLSELVSFDKMEVDHVLNGQESAHPSVLNEDTYKHLIELINDRLSISRNGKILNKKNIRFTSIAYLCNGDDLANLLTTFNTLSEEQKEQTIKYFSNN